MKILSVFILLIILFTAGAYSQYKWTDAQYHYQTGSVPPPYFFEYDVFINAGGQGTLVYHSSYSTDSTSKMDNYTFTVNASDISSLNNAIKKSKVLTATFKEMENHPIGGSMQNAIILLYQDPALDHMPQRITTPYFPASSKQRKALEILYGKIKSLVPQTIWDEIESKKNK